MIKKILASVISIAMCLAPVTTVFADSGRCNVSHLEVKIETNYPDIVQTTGSLYERQYRDPIWIEGTGGAILRNYDIPVVAGYKFDDWTIQEGKVYKVQSTIIDGRDSDFKYEELPVGQHIESLAPTVTKQGDNQLKRTYYVATYCSPLKLKANFSKTDKQPEYTKEIYLSVNGKEAIPMMTVTSDKENTLNAMFPTFINIGGMHIEQQGMVKHEEQVTITSDGETVKQLDEGITNYYHGFASQSYGEVEMTEDGFTYTRVRYTTDDTKLTAITWNSLRERHRKVEYFIQLGDDAPYYDYTEELEAFESGTTDTPKDIKGWKFSHYRFDTSFVEAICIGDKTHSGFTCQQGEHKIIEAGGTSESVLSESSIEGDMSKFSILMHTYSPVGPLGKITAVYVKSTDDGKEPPETPTEPPKEEGTTETPTDEPKTPPTDTDEPKQEEPSTPETPTNTEETPKNPPAVDEPKQEEPKNNKPTEVKVDNTKTDVNPAKGDEPQTGDNSNIILYSVLSGVSLLVAVGLTKKRKIREK